MRIDGRFLRRRSIFQSRRTNRPAQLHDLFMVARAYTESPDFAISKLSSSDEIEDSRKKAGPLFPSFYDSGPRYLEFLREIIKKFDVKIVVETGVAHGHSTRVILGSLQDVLDRKPDTKVEVHSLDVDQRTKWPDMAGNPNWVFHLVTENRTVETILSEIGEIDMFIHDSDHSYFNQMREYRAAWAHLKPGGFLISDDVSWSNAFIDFCNQNKLGPVVLSEAPKVAGAVRKPPSS